VGPSSVFIERLFPPEGLHKAVKKEMLLIRKLFTPPVAGCDLTITVELLGKEKIEVHPKTGALFFMAEASR
jgi:hypothetical protein